MPHPSFDELVPLLQISIGPVILISGVGLLLLSMTNRLGRVIDRSRHLAESLAQGAPAGRHIDRQLDILYRRSRLVRRAIFLASLSVLLVAILIIVLFFAALLRVDAFWPISLLFAGALIALVASLVAFIQDVHLSLVALDLELSRPTDGPV